MGPVLLFDAFSLFFRAFYALPPMSTVTGLPTSGLYGLSALLLKLFREEHPVGGAFALDPPTPTFRHVVYPAYKGTRGGAPGPLLSQLDLLPELLDAFGLPIHAALGFEADDVLATLARQLCEVGEAPMVVSGDRDCLQLTRRATRVLYVARGVEAQRYDAASVEERFGVPPMLLPDYQALVGDPSDNLPGVPGIGPRTAAQLLRTYGGLVPLLARLGDVEPARIRERLGAHADRLPLWLHLARLREDVPLRAGPRFRPLDMVGTRRLFRDLEFESLLPRLDALEAADYSASSTVS